MLQNAEALSVDPDVLSLDEPSVGLSATSRPRLKETIAHLRDIGKAILITENDIDLVTKVVDTVPVLDQGRVVFQRPCQRFVPR